MNVNIGIMGLLMCLFGLCVSQNGRSISQGQMQHFLLHAMRKGDVKNVLLAIQNGASVDKTNIRDGRSPLSSLLMGWQAQVEGFPRTDLVSTSKRYAETLEQVLVKPASKAKRRYRKRASPDTLEAKLSTSVRAASVGCPIQDAAQLRLLPAAAVLQTKSSKNARRRCAAQLDAYGQNLLHVLAGSRSQGFSRLALRLRAELRADAAAANAPSLGVLSGLVGVNFLGALAGSEAISGGQIRPVLRTTGSDSSALLPAHAESQAGTRRFDRPWDPLWRWGIEAAVNSSQITQVLNPIRQPAVAAAQSTAQSDQVHGVPAPQVPSSFPARLLRAREAHGRTPLGLACQEGQIGVVNLLLLHGAQAGAVADTTTGGTCLHLAAQSRWPAVVETVLGTYAHSYNVTSEGPPHRAPSVAVDLPGTKYRSTLLRAVDSFDRTPCDIAVDLHRGSSLAHVLCSIHASAEVAADGAAALAEETEVRGRIDRQRQSLLQFIGGEQGSLAHHEGGVVPQHLEHTKQDGLIPDELAPAAVVLTASVASHVTSKAVRRLQEALCSPASENGDPLSVRGTAGSWHTCAAKGKILDAVVRVLQRIESAEGQRNASSGSDSSGLHWSPDGPLVVAGGGAQADGVWDQIKGAVSRSMILGRPVLATSQRRSQHEELLLEGEAPVLEGVRDGGQQSGWVAPTPDGGEEILSWDDLHALAGPGGLERNFGGAVVRPSALPHGDVYSAGPGEGGMGGGVLGREARVAAGEPLLEQIGAKGGVDTQNAPEAVSLADYVRSWQEDGGEEVEARALSMGAGSDTPLVPSPKYVFDGRTLVADPAMKRFPHHRLHAANATVRQIALGPAGSGAMPHFHGKAVNAAITGCKLWFVWPPCAAFFVESDALTWVQRGAAEMQPPSACSASVSAAAAGGSDPVPVYRFLQCAGEVAVVPEGYGHAVVNLTPSLAVAWEEPA